MDEEIARKAGEYLNTYRATKHIELADALIAATAFAADAELITRNIKHYPMNKIITTPRGIIIRQGQESDAQAYRELRLEALHNHPEAFSADFAIYDKQPMTYWTERLHSLEDERMIYFADCNDSLVGTCGIYRGDSPKTKHSGTIVGVYVKSEWRGLRIADEMIAACIVWARLHKIRIVKLGVNTANTSAIRCYTRCGFTTYGTEPQAIYANSRMYDELLMARTI